MTNPCVRARKLVEASLDRVDEVQGMENLSTELLKTGTPVEGLSCLTPVSVLRMLGAGG